MNDETYRYFSIGLKEMLKKKGFNQSKFSKGIMNTPNFSNCLNTNHHTQMSDTNRDKCSKKIGMSVDELVEIGKQSFICETYGLDSMSLSPYEKYDFPQSAREKYFWQLYRENGEERILDEFIVRLYQKAGIIDTDDKKEE